MNYSYGIKFFLNFNSKFVRSLKINIKHVIIN